MSEILLSRDPSPKMVAVLETFARADGSSITEAIRKRRTRWWTWREEARDVHIPEPELAAWTMVASEMLNLDETREQIGGDHYEATSALHRLRAEL